MSGHVVWAFVSMLPRARLRGQVAQPSLEITLNTGVRVLLDDEARRSMPDEYGTEPHGDRAVRHNAAYLGCDVRWALAPGGDPNQSLVDHTGGTMCQRIQVLASVTGLAGQSERSLRATLAAGPIEHENQRH